MTADIATMTTDVEPTSLVSTGAETNETSVAPTPAIADKVKKKKKQTSYKENDAEKNLKLFLEQAKQQLAEDEQNHRVFLRCVRGSISRENHGTPQIGSDGEYWA